MQSYSIDLIWPESYPETVMEFNMDMFYNNHLSSEVKMKIMDDLRNFSHENLGSPHTFDIIDYMKSSYEKFFDQDQVVIKPVQVSINVDASTSKSKAKEDKPEKLTKSQKRKSKIRYDKNGELPRGWDWVDVVQHLRKTGASSA